MCKTRRSTGRNAEFYVIELTQAANQPTEFHTEEELTADQRDNFRSLLCDNFPELLQPVDSPLVSRQWDHPIETTGPMKRRRSNRLSPVERAELNRQLKDAVDAGLIRPSYNEFGSPIIFVCKADGSLRLCMDYRGLNEVTRKYADPLPRVDDTLDELKDANFYTHLDLASCFWQVRVRDHNIHKTAFQTPDGLLEWIAMPFGLYNAPATFQRMMNDILRDFLYKFIIVYLDDVCIYNRTLEEHLEHMLLVLQRFKEEGLKLRLKKCFFGLQEMEFLGYTVSAGKILVSTKKIEAVAHWPLPTTQKEVGSFVQFCNFYARFIHHFSDITAPLTDLLRKSQPQKVTVTPACLEAFETLKLRLIFAPCVILPEVGSGATLTVATYASTVGIARVMLQDQGGGLQPLSYWARKLNPAERGSTYYAYDLEALAVYEAVKHWRCYPEVCSKFLVVIDHDTLRHLLR
jgi:hypothetical protein